MPIFFFNDTATTEIYTLSLHDALPICNAGGRQQFGGLDQGLRSRQPLLEAKHLAHLLAHRSEEHTSELQSRPHLVCRLLLAKINIMACSRTNERATESLSVC